ncbi:hypothetical protein POJ06DRAFT_246948 [Lipomyces tetrasporus]|uniref:ER membrane protein complex subunit 2 n=1 Tax=Lipomyces tetrasporus TaxID=54092 RepID=A0AAD7QXD6_9ASCO|nr:uncharacterized protein POJ06DRAFT_246948 [Lipomyces tetrasporus]KAJ8103228.1 hypothetical protein POJ06DRAFT_246948 [Lipomyces tetrasporus]
MTTTIDILRNAQTTSSYLTLAPEEFQSLYDISYKFVTSGAAARSLPPANLYNVFELQFFLSIIAGKDTEASAILATLTDRFRQDSHRVGVLRSIYLEATEGPLKALEFVSGRPDTELGTLKRKIVILKSSNQTSHYISELLKLVDNFPSDAESWAELASAYAEAGMYAQSLFALHEVLLLVPLAYNINALIGETSLVYASSLQAASSSHSVAIEERLFEAVKFFLRSVELCEDYVRGWAGVLVTTKRIAAIQKPVGDTSTYKRLYDVARNRLAKIVETQDASESELASARLVLKNY